MAPNGPAAPPRGHLRQERGLHAEEPRGHVEAEEVAVDARPRHGHAVQLLVLRRRHPEQTAPLRRLRERTKGGGGAA